MYCYFLLPETKNLTLEELDVVFNIGNHEHFKYYSEKAPWCECVIDEKSALCNPEGTADSLFFPADFGKYILRKDVEPIGPLCQVYDDGRQIADVDEKAVV